MIVHPVFRQEHDDGMFPIGHLLIPFFREGLEYRKGSVPWVVEEKAKYALWETGRHFQAAA